MKAKELRAKNSTELKEIENELLRESFNLRMQKAVGQLSKSNKIRENRKTIARIKTIISEMEHSNV